MTSATERETETISGVRLHAGAVRRYRERTPGSREALEKMRKLVPTGHTGGMSFQLPYPMFMTHAKGSRIWDVDGNEYFDFRIGDWVLIHGHCNDTIRDAIVAQLDKAVQFGAPEWDLGYRMASLLVERMPSFEKVRFAVSGTDCNGLALRLARTYTGRQRMAKMNAGYHGVSDHLLVANGVAAVSGGAPAGVLSTAVDQVAVLPFNDPDGAEAIIESQASELAAVLVEPIMGVGGMVPATKEFLQRLRDVTERHGIVLIFDEVVTFPVAYGGAQAYYGVNPDLTTLSKSIGGGLPLGAVGGKAEIMDLMDPQSHGGTAPVAHASTFGGNQAALASGIACLELLTPDAHAKVQALGERARNGIDEIGRKHGIPLHATGFGHIFAPHWAAERVVDDATLQGDDREKVMNLILGLNNEGYYAFSFGALLLSTAVTEADVDEFLAATERALQAVELV